MSVHALVVVCAAARSLGDRLVCRVLFSCGQRLQAALLRAAALPTSHHQTQTQTQAPRRVAGSTSKLICQAGPSMTMDGQGSCTDFLCLWAARSASGGAGALALVLAVSLEAPYA